MSAHSMFLKLGRPGACAHAWRAARVCSWLPQAWAPTLRGAVSWAQHFFARLSCETGDCSRQATHATGCACGRVGRPWRGGRRRHPLRRSDRWRGPARLALPALHGGGAPRWRRRAPHSFVCAMGAERGEGAGAVSWGHRVLRVCPAHSCCALPCMAGCVLARGRPAMCCAHFTFHWTQLPVCSDVRSGGRHYSLQPLTQQRAVEQARWRPGCWLAAPPWSCPSSVRRPCAFLCVHHAVLGRAVPLQP